MILSSNRVAALVVTLRNIGIVGDLLEDFPQCGWWEEFVQHV